MLRSTPIRQFPNDLAKRWAHDDYFDLVIWYDPPDTFYGFQLSYDLQGIERTLKWTPVSGYLNTLAEEDHLGGSLCRFGSVLLHSTAEFPFEKVRSEFAQRTSQFDPGLRDLVMAHIIAFGTKHEGP